MVVYNNEELTEDDLPDSILEFTDPAWQGRIGWAPTNALVPGLRHRASAWSEGEDGARAWLEGIQANEPVAYDNNIAVVEAVAAGEIDVGFVNHYYLHQFLADDPDYPASYKFYGGGDVGGLVNVAGAGIVDTADNTDAANAVRRLPPRRGGADATSPRRPTRSRWPTACSRSRACPTLDELDTGVVDLNQLDDLAGTLALLTELGIV